MASTSRGENASPSCGAEHNGRISGSAHSKASSKLIPFSIDAILNSPHPRKTTRPRIRRTQIVTASQVTGCALSSLEKFTSVSLKDKGETESKEDAAENIQRTLAALQARLTHRKRRKARTCFTNHQIFELERRFLYQKYLSPSARDELSQALGLSGAQIITWFQNRRAKFRRELEELKSDVAHAKILPAEQIQKMCKELEI